MSGRADGTGARRFGRAGAKAAAAALAALLLLPACEKLDRNMYDNPAFKAQEAPVRTPPAGSVPTKGRERIPSPAEAARLANPVPPTPWNLLRGKELYGIFCVPCHGPGGKGDGPVAAKYVPAPPDISATGHGAHHKDGEIFLVLAAGQGGMPALRHDLSPEERWTVVHHLRTLR